MNSENIQNEIIRLQKIYDLLHKIKQPDTLEDRELIKEIKGELQKKIDKLSKEREREFIREQKKKKNAMTVVYRILPLFSGITFLALTIWGLLGNTAVALETLGVNSVLFLYNFILLVMVMAIISDFRQKVITGTVFGGLVIWGAMEFFTGYNPLKIINILYVSQGLSLISFIYSVMQKNKNR